MTTKKNLTNAEKEQNFVAKEIAKIKKDFATADKQATTYIKKNPKKATIISAGVGVAIGATVTALIASNTKK
jgi:ElaB/YqjD/DUF883 family membrane-anchored ribosome-binding protein